MIYVCGGTKGGSGKTTLATQLTVILSMIGRDVLLVDADDQATASKFTMLRNEMREGGAGYTLTRLTGKAVRTEVQRQLDKYDDVIIDVGGRDTSSQRAALVIADVLLMPLLPRTSNIWTLDDVEPLVEDAIAIGNDNLKAYTFLNMADSQGSFNDVAAEAISASEMITYLDAPLVYRKVYGWAESSGMSIMEYKPRDKKAVQELNRLLQQVIPQFKELAAL